VSRTFDEKKKKEQEEKKKKHKNGARLFAQRR